jgi:PAS domain S-box-containing protein
MSTPVNNSGSASPDAESGKSGLRAKLIGLGERSISKSYYPELKERLDDLERFRALLDQIHETILLADAPSGRIVDATGACRAMLRCGREALLGKDFTEFLDSEAAGLVRSVLAGARTVRGVEAKLCVGDCGEPLPVEMSIRVATLAGVTQAVIVVRDVTERAQAREKLEQYHRELEQRVGARTAALRLANERLKEEVAERRRAEEAAESANRLKSEFLSLVSHELRTPLTSVLGFAKIIERKLVNMIFPKVVDPDLKTRKAMEQTLHDVRVIGSEGARLTTLINDVLDLAKMEAGRLQMRKDRVSLREVVLSSAAASAGAFEGGGVQLKMRVPDEEIFVEGDRDRLMQVLMNLLSNAAKFTEHGYVLLGLERRGAEALVTVEDTGMGIAAEDQERVFGKFDQVGDPVHGRPRGTGLGLAICRRIVEAHGGTIWVQSEKGKGSVFLYSLPIPI